MKEFIASIIGIVFAIMAFTIKLFSSKAKRAEKKVESQEREIEALHNTFEDRKEVEKIAVEAKRKQEVIKETYEEEKRNVENISEKSDDSDVIAHANDFYNRLRDKYGDRDSSEN